MHEIRYHLSSSFRRLLPSLLIAFLTLAGAYDATAQRIVNVEPGPGTLNEAIIADTTETGARVDTNTVYVLERGGLYLLEGSIENRFPLTIVAADGEGDRPILQPAIIPGGTESVRAFRPRGDLTLRGLYVTNEDELGGLKTRIFRLSADDIRITIEDCHLDKDGQSAFRFDNAGISVFIRNSIISNIGTTDGGMNNGRGFDTRGNDIDSLVIENSTFYNLTSRIVREDGGFIRYHKFDHNTVVNVGQFVSSPGEVQEMVWTNNLVINGGYLGQTDFSNVGRQLIQIDSLAVDSLGNPIRDGEQVIRISNNNFHVDPSIVAAYGDSVRTLPNFDPTAQAYLDERGFGDTITDEAVELTNSPPVPLDVFTARWMVGTENPSPEEAGLIPDFSNEGAPFDFSYAMTYDSYTASRAGQPLGALNWFGLEVIPVSTEAGSSELPESFRVSGNYPNPFNPSTRVQFDLPGDADVSVAVFDLLGREVLAIPAQAMTAGADQTIRIDAGELASGIYLYQVRAEMASRRLVGTGRMVLIK